MLFRSKEYLDIPSNVFIGRKPNITKGWAALYKLEINRGRQIEEIYPISSLYINANYYLLPPKKTQKIR